MINIDLLTELAKCSVFSAKKKELLKVQPRVIREVFDKQHSAEIKAMVSTKKIYPNFSAVTAY
jgi:hypothetical protein